MSKKIFLYIFYIYCLALFVINFFLHFDHHGFKIEELPVFYPLMGFFSFIIIVLIAQYLLRPALKRKEEFYD